MTRSQTLLLAAAALTTLSGCVRTVASVVTAPVRVAGKAVDWSTTSQSEADRNRGREIRRREERLGKLQRSYEKHLRGCSANNEEACEQARSEHAEIQGLTPTVPYEPR